MHRRLLAALLVAVVVVGSVGSSGASARPGQETDTTRARAVDAQVIGTVVSGSSGQPLGDVPIQVRATDTGADPIWTFLPFFVFTGGLGALACITGECFERQQDSVVANTRTAGDGSYSATLPRSYVAGTETDTDWVVQARLPAAPGQSAGPVSTFEFEVNIQTQEAQELPMWDVAPEVTVDGWAVGVDAANGLRSLDGTTVNLVSDHGSLVGRGSHAVFDARLLEVPAGATGGLGVMAQGKVDLRVSHANGRTIYHQRVRSAVLPVDLSPVPPSRGAACSGVRRDGQPATVGGPSGCRATDGDLGTQVAPPPPRRDPFADSSTTTLDPAGLVSLTVELAEPLDLGMVVVRAGSSELQVEVSADGGPWVPASTSFVQLDGGGVHVATPTTPVTARYVRVSDPSGLSAAEVSAWKAVPGAEAGAPAPGLAGRDPDVSGAFVEGDGDRPGDGGGWPVGPVLLAAAAGVVLWLVVRRRRQVTAGPPAPPSPVWSRPPAPMAPPPAGAPPPPPAEPPPPTRRRPPGGP